MSPNTSGSWSNSSSLAYVIFAFSLVFICVGFYIGICIACFWCQKAINAANLGKVGGAHGTDLKSYPETNTVQKGDPNDYKL